jgi:hypothetical protein
MTDPRAPLVTGERELLHAIISDCHALIDVEAHPELSARIEAVLLPCDDAGQCVAALLVTPEGAQGWQPIDVEAMRAQLHATFNGGWHGNDDGMKAFHHGMDTVCNVLAAHQKRESTNGILPALVGSPAAPEKEQP